MNEQVKRNIARFPNDFMFRLTADEKNKVVAICDHLSVRRFSHQLPYVFTELGVAMLSSVLNSDKAVQMNIFIMRAFVKLRRMISNNKDLANKVDKLELEQIRQGIGLTELYSHMKRFMDKPISPKHKLRFDIRRV